MKLSLGLTPRDYSVAGGAVAYDTDAQAYFTANTAITSSADKNAINSFYLGLKSDGIYSKIKAMYLPIWGSASVSKWNLVNPLDTNAAFRLTFATGYTFTNSGMKGNGTSAYAITYLFPNLIPQNSAHLSLYSRTNVAEGVIDMGNSGTFVGANYNLITLRNSSNLISIGINSTLQDTVSNTDSRSFFIANRTASNVLNCFKNNTKIINTTTASLTPEPNAIYISSVNRDNTPLTYSSKEFSFVSIGNGLTDTEANKFYNRVQTLMTYFGINV